MKYNSILSLFSLENKVAVVTGACGYFGKSFSECLLFAGAKVVLFGRGAKIKEFSSILKAKYGDGNVDYYLTDFYDERAFRKCLVETASSNKTIDILVNNAYEFSKETGFNDPSGKIENISKKQWIRSLESGVYWHALATQIIGEKMKQQRCGSIINISSMYALVSPDPNLYEGVEIFNPPSYGAAKAAILAFTRYTASFYGKFGIRCNAIVSGAFPNVNKNSFNSPKNKSFLNRLSERTVLERYGMPDDLKGVLIFLASDSSSYITGQVIVVDGGWTIT